MTGTHARYNPTRGFEVEMRPSGAFAKACAMTEFLRAISFMRSRSMPLTTMSPAGCPSGPEESADFSAAKPTLPPAESASLIALNEAFVQSDQRGAFGRRQGGLR